MKNSTHEIEQRMREQDSSPAGKLTQPIVIHFPSDGFLLMQIAGGGPLALSAFGMYVKDQFSTSVVLICMAILFVAIRAKFKTRPPDWASIDPSNKIMRLKQRWPHRAETIVDISKLKFVDVYVQRFRKFPHSVVELNFDDTTKRSLFFDVESSETRFFATPNEVVPVSVEELAQVLREVAVQEK